MSAIDKGRTPTPDFVHPELAGDRTAPGRAFDYLAAVTRISIGWVFLWAFLDKAFALGYATGRNPDTDAVDYFGDAA